LAFNARHKTPNARHLLKEKMKKKTTFACTSCGYNSPKWLGRCPNCGEYNTLVEETSVQRKTDVSYRKFQESKIGPITDIEVKAESRLTTGISEADRVLGGGIVKGSLVLLGGEPGAGKSTLALAIAGNIAENGKKVIYLSAEESDVQIKMRSDRLGIKSKNLLLMIETSVEAAAEAMEKEKPALLVIDSIQTVYKDEIDAVAGSVNQVRESCAHILYAAKKSSVPVIIIGHVTKEGSLAGPKMLEHMVDTVLYFEAEKFYQFKVLRAVKNRFGSVNEIGVFEMTGEGLKEITSPSKILLDNLKESKQGSAISAVIEGTRPILLEIQALTSRRSWGNPQRTVTGIDYNRFLLILAVLEKKLNLNLENQDVFVNVSGGIRIVETACDLAVAAAVYSDFKETPISSKTIFIGELGLDGELRAVRFMENRLSEAARMGFTKAIIPAGTKAATVKNIETVKIKDIAELKKIIDNE
jgi:DNA repair protein RadA/Sms